MILKADRWWVYKIAGGLLTAVLFTLHFQVAINDGYWRMLGILFGIFVALAIFGHLINDLSDMQVDLHAGKTNLVNSVGVVAGIVLILLVGLLALVLSIYFLPTAVSVMVSVQMVLNTAYSLRPFRFKERGFLGLIVTGFYERSLPYLMVISLLLFVDGGDGLHLDRLAYTYLSWSFVWEMRNYLKGQTDDMESDNVAKVRSIALVLGLTSIVRMMLVLFIAEIVLFFAWVSAFEHFAVIAAVSLLLSWYFHQRVNGWKVRGRQVFGIVDDVYNFNLPVLFAFSASLTYATEFWYLTVLLLVGFDNYPRKLLLVLLDKLKWQILGLNLSSRVPKGLKRLFGK